MSTVLDIRRVVEDINTLYSSHDSTRISSVQERLQRYQRSNEGYSLGIELLNNDTKNVKYFGALTLTVYLNNHSVTEVDSVFNTIVFTILSLIQQGYDGNLFIIKKLLSNLSLLYIKYFSIFTQDPVKKLLSTMRGREDPVDEMIRTLEKDQAELVLLFLSIIVEDITKQSTNLTELHDKVHTTLFEHYKLIYHYLSTITLPYSTKLLSLDCITSLVVYISTAEGNSTQRYSQEDMSVFVIYVLNYLQDDVNTNNMEIYNKCFTVLAEFLENIPRLINTFKQQISQLLFNESNFGMKFINVVVSNNEIYSSEIENFVNLIIAYLSNSLVYISRNILSDSIVNILNVVIKLTDFPGIPIEDETISEQLIPFWQELADTFIDDSDAITDIIFDSETLDQFKSRKISIFMEISRIYFRKAKVISTTKEFFQYRNQIGELFILLYSLINTPIYSALCEIIQSNLSLIKTNPNVINDLETGLYLVFKITDDLRFYDDEFAINTLAPLINSFFIQGLIETIEQIPNYHTHQISITLLNLLSCLNFFFKSEIGSTYLPSTFNFLFSMILSDNTNTKLSLIASRTILKICQDSKDKLVQFLPNLQLILVEMLKNPKFDSLIRERLTNSYISIASSVKDPVDLGNRIYHLLLQISEQYNVVLTNPIIEDEKCLEEYTTSLLSCVYEIGKAVIIPEELEDYLTPGQINHYNIYWNGDPLSIKPMILTILNQFSLQFTPLIQKTIITEKCCNILKCGLTEPINGPFKFNYTVIFEYLIAKIKQCNIHSIPYIYKLVETVVITNRRELTSEELQKILVPIFNDMYQILESDVDLIKSSIEMFSTLIENCPGLILSSELFQSKVLNYALISLKNYHEVFVIKAVVKFWNGFIMLKRGNQSDLQVKNYLIGNLDVNGFPLGYQIVNSAMIGFVNAPRSTLEYYYAIFRNLIGKYPMEFKTWLLYFLENVHIGKVELTLEEITQFVNKLMITRGQRRANDILRDYWLKVNKLTNY